jgi:hypothetical protein
MISGLACPRESWLAFLGPETNVITLHDVLEATLASSNDPYTSLASLRRIQDDFLIPNFYVLDYGHFPYSAPSSETVRQYIYNFEATTRVLLAKSK